MKFSSWNYMLWTKTVHQSIIFQIFECSNENSTNSSCYFWNRKFRVYSNFASLFSAMQDGLLIINWAFISEKTKQSVYYLAQNIDLIKSIVLRLNMVRYTLNNIIQWHTLWDETLSGESMALKVINKINSRVRFLYRKNRVLSSPLRRFLYNSLVQPHFDYACSAWYVNLNKRLKSKLQILQNKCIRFCLNLNNRAHIKQKELEQINWLPVNNRFKQIISWMSFKFCNNTSPPYMGDVFKPAGQPNTTARASLLKLNQPLRRTNDG